MAQFCAFVVRLPSGERYWTVIDERYRPVPQVDDFLLHLRLGRDCAESTTEAYARSLVLFLRWCARVGLDWPVAGTHLGRFMHWLAHYDPSGPDGVVGTAQKLMPRLRGVKARGPAEPANKAPKTVEMTPR